MTELFPVQEKALYEAASKEAAKDGDKADAAKKDEPVEGEVVDEKK